MSKRIVTRELRAQGDGVCAVELFAAATVLGVHVEPDRRRESTLVMSTPPKEPAFVVVLSALIDDETRHAPGTPMQVRTFVLVRAGDRIVEPPDTFLSYVGHVQRTPVHVFERCAVSAVREEPGA